MKYKIFNMSSSIITPVLKEFTHKIIHGFGFGMGVTFKILGKN